MLLTPTQKGGLAELKIAAAAADLEIGVYRPMIEGNRCDLVSRSATAYCGSSASGRIVEETFWMFR